MLKEQARLHYRQHRLSLSDAERKKAINAMYTKFVEIPFPYSSEAYFLSYQAIASKGEVSMLLFEEHLIRRGMLKAIPRTNGDSFDAVAVEETTQYKRHVSFDVLEPVNGETICPNRVAVVLVPSIIFDNVGCRVGYGKGIYDRFMAQLQPNCLKVAFSFFPPIDNVEDCQQYDVSISVGITPHHTYWFN